MGDAKYKPGDRITKGSLLRRVPPDTGSFPRGLQELPSRQAFEPKKGDSGISAYLAELTTEDEALGGNQGFALVEIEIAEVTARGFTVTYDPTANERGHVLVKGVFSPSARKALSQNCKVKRVGDATLWQRNLPRKI